MIIHDVSEYIHWNIPRPEYYVQDILPKQGVMLVYGSPKVRKSWLVQYMAFCIATGTEFLGFNTTQARVLMAQFEISPIAYAWRLRDMAQHFTVQEQMFYETSPGLMYLEENETFNRFSAAIRELHPKVIILDCMAACFGGDENDGGDVARFIEKLSLMKQEHEASVVLVHHTNKSMQNNTSVDRARGHSRLTGWVDTLVYMAEQPSAHNTVQVQLQFKARQATRELHNLNINFANYRWSLRGENGN